LAFNRELRIKIDRRPLDTEIAQNVAGPQWQIMFHGIIDTVDWGGDDNTLTIECRDIGARLMDVFIPVVSTRSTTGGTAVETVMQGIITDSKGDTPPANYANNWGLPNLTTWDLYTPITPSWNITQYSQQQMSVHEAISRLAEQIGWTIRTVFDEGLSSYRQTFYEPSRRQTWPQLTIDEDKIISCSGISASLQDVRNEIWVTFTPKSGASLTVPFIPSGTNLTPGVQAGTVYVGAAGVYAPATTSDGEEGNRVTFIIRSDDLDASEQGQNSITIHGVRRMINGESSSSNIDTVTEAQKMAVTQLRDLHEPLVSQTIKTNAIPEVEIGDLIRIRSNGIWYTSDQTLSVTTIDIDIGQEGVTSTLGLRGRPSGGTKIHLEKEVRRGLADPPTHDHTATEMQSGMTTRQRRQMHLSMTTMSAQYMRQSRQLSGVRNSDFAMRTQGEAPPDAWTQTAGTWNTDAQLNKTSVESGAQTVSFPTSTGILGSDWIPCRQHQHIAVEVRAMSNGPSVTIYVDFYDKNRQFISTPGSQTFTLNGLDLWCDRLSVTHAPASASWMKVRIGRNAVAGTLYVNHVNAFIIKQNFRAYRNVNQALTNGIGTQNAIVFDVAETGSRPDAWVDGRSSIGSPNTVPYSTATGLYTAPQEGWYEFSSNIRFDGGSTVKAFMKIRQNGAAGAIRSESPGIAQDATITSSLVLQCHTGLVWMNASNTMGVYANIVDSAGIPAPIVVGGADSWFAGKQVFMD
jgi:hypothetical protein